MGKSKKIAWITDSTCSLSEEFISLHNIEVIPLNVIFGDTSYKENIEITAEQFYEKLSASDALPKTSQPAIGEFVERFKELKEKYEYGIAIHASSSLTGTYQGSLMAAEMVGFPVQVIDSKVGSYALGNMIEQGILLEKSGKSYETIVEYIRTLPDKARLYLVPGSLEQLQKGGRLSTTQTFIGNLLKLQLIIKFEDGKVILSEKVRTVKKVKKRLYEIFDEASHKIKEASVVHGNDRSIAEEWKEELQKIYPNIRFTTTILSPVAGSHTGQGTMGLSWIKK
ncbi:DegV family protein [Bacillus sp. 2205SS5-2]|uniref:DegV family protein n=1 Tax=Bacillus sp. 2205SS5-2 TaxID=3109031 RepID=UPI0030052D71